MVSSSEYHLVDCVGLDGLDVGSPTGRECSPLSMCARAWSARCAWIYMQTCECDARIGYSHCQKLTAVSVQVTLDAVVPSTNTEVY